MGRRASAPLAAILALSVAAIPGIAGAHTPRPGSPTSMHVTKVTRSGFTVAMKAAPHATRYRLFASTTRSDLFVGSTLRAIHSGYFHRPTVSISGLTNSGSTTYYYRVEALNGLRWHFSDQIGEVGLRPAAPTRFHATSSHAKTYVTWHAGQASGFQIEQSTSPSMHANVKKYNVRGRTSSYTPYGLTKGRHYYFRVRSLNAKTPSTFSGTAQAVVQSRSQSVKIMTYNIKEARFDGVHEGGDVVAPWSKRKPAVAALIRRANPGVVGIEEGASPIGGRGGPRMVDTLRKALGRNWGVARTEIPPRKPGTQRTGDYVLYQKSLYRTVGRGGHWALGSNHFAAYQVLRSRQSGAKFLVVVAHELPALGEANDVRRRQETQVVVKRGHALAARKGIPVVYAGDFNSDPFKHHAFNAPAQVMAQHKIADAYNVAQTRIHANYNTANHYMRRPPHVGARIDYVFAPQGVGVKSWKVIMRIKRGKFIGTIPSDHNPVVVTLSIPV